MNKVCLNLVSTLLKIVIFIIIFHVTPSARAATTFQSYQLNPAGLTILLNPFAELKVLPNDQYSISVTSLYYAPTALTLLISDSLTESEVHSISSSPVTSSFMGDPMIPGSSFVAFSWQETFTGLQTLASHAENGELFFSYFDETNARQTARFYSSIPEPSELLLGIVTLCVCLIHRGRARFEK